jgi:hypothetical protein
LLPWPSTPTSDRRSRPTLFASSWFWLVLITAVVVVLRLPSFFEPPWNTDEGIFGAVAQRVIEGGKLYRDAWESKPPLFLYLYVGIFKVFGPGVFGLRLAATASAIGTELATFLIARRLMSERRALLAAALCGVFLAVPFWEGTLALTEIFTVLPTGLAVVVLLDWDRRTRPELNRVDALLVAAGVLFGAAFLLRQTSLAGAAAGGVWLVLRGRPWRRALVFGGFGFALSVVPVVAAFELSGDFHWFWDANVAFFFKYVPSGQQLPFASRPLILLPFSITAVALALTHLRRVVSPKWTLPALWLTLTLAGALVTGRPYSHYFLQSFPPLAILIAMALPGPGIDLRPRLHHLPAALFVGALILEWVCVVTPMFSGNAFAMHWTRGPYYYQNFAEYLIGKRTRVNYEAYFDGRVRYTRVLTKALARLHAEDQKVYIWGEYPWAYTLARVEPSSRYMTSFYVLLLPYQDVNLGSTLDLERPRYIVVMSDARPRMSPASPIIDQRWTNAKRSLDALLMSEYQLVSSEGRADIYRRLPARSRTSILSMSTGDVPYDFPGDLP